MNLTYAQVRGSKLETVRKRKVFSRRKQSVVTAVILCLLISSVPYFSDAAESQIEGSTFDVPDDFSTIQDAVNNAEDGDTIFVKEGTYVEQVIVNKKLLLIGENPRETTIDGHNLGTTLKIVVDDVNVSGFRIIGSSGDGGIDVVSAHNCYINDNIVEQNSLNGIFIEDASSNISVFDNFIRQNVYNGLYIWNGSTNNNVTGNWVTDNGYYGINIHKTSNNNTISKNIFRQNIRAGVVLDNSSFNKILSNNIGLDDKTSDGKGVWLAYDSSNNEILDNKMENYPYGLDLVLLTGQENRIYHNTFIDNTISYVKSSTPTENVWDDGYPSGGNYWSDYLGSDNFSGENQDVPGSDGIGDIPYEVDELNVDKYPHVNLKTQNLNIFSVPDGTTTPGFGQYNYSRNSAVKITAMPTDNYIFDHWIIDGAHAGEANPYTLLMDEDHAVEATFVFNPNPSPSPSPTPSPSPPDTEPLSVSITPSALALKMGGSVTFTSTITGTPPYTYQWFMDDKQVVNAVSNSWTFTPETAGIFEIYLNVTDDSESTEVSNIAKIRVLETDPPGTTTLLSIADAYVNNINSGALGLTVAFVSEPGVMIDIQYNSYIMFDLSEIPSNAEINSARFDVRMESMTIEQENYVSAFVTETSWTEESINWSNQPALIYNLGYQQIALPLGSWYSWTIPVEQVQEVIQSTEKISIGLKCTYLFGTTFVFFQSRGTENPPMLVIEYTIQPSPTPTSSPTSTPNPLSPTSTPEPTDPETTPDYIFPFIIILSIVIIAGLVVILFILKMHSKKK